MAPDDVTAVLTLLDDYCRLLDGGRDEEWLALFTEEGRLVVGTKTFEGADGLRRFLDARKGGGLHLNAVPALTTVDADTVETDVPFFGLQPGTDGDARIRGVGRYRDRLRRGAGGWRFAERRVELTEGF